MKTRELSWNRPQTNFLLNLHKMKKATIIGSRGVGKSFVIAEIIRKITKWMPRSSWSIQGATYQQLLTRTLPGTFEALEVLGFERDKDYWIKTKPRVKSQYLPYYKPLSWDNYITVKGSDGYCVGFMLLSQDTSSRGPTTDGIICDESLLLDQEKFVKESKFTNRGHEKYFGKINMHHSIFHLTSMPTGNSWLFDASKYYGDKLPEMLALQSQLVELQYQWLGLTTKKEKLELWAEIIYLMEAVEWYVSSKGEFYAEWNIFDNIENLTLRYIYEMYAGTPKQLFLTEGLNARTKKIDDGFYPQLDRTVHCYSKFNNSYLENLDFDIDKLRNLDSQQDGDCDPALPLHIGTDYGNAINWIIVGQKVDKSRTFNVIKEFYVKSPKILDHAVLEFCKYYRNHKEKHVHIYPDAEAFTKRANSTETYIDTTIKILKAHKWSVTLGHRMRYNKLQNDTFHLINLLLSERDLDLWRIRFNPYNCKGLLLSMEQAPAYDSRGLVRKDKNSEKKLKINREEATDASDAFDQIIYYLFRHTVTGGRLLLTSSIFS